MVINKLTLENFMIFNHLDIDFSPNINIISGENSTGKTALIKLLYSLLKGYADVCRFKGDITKDKLEDSLVSKMRGVFQPDQNAIGRLVNRKQGSNRTDITVKFDKTRTLRVGFGNRQTRHMDILSDAAIDLEEVSPVYIPPKEIISATENFGSLYSDYHMAFEETYYDLCRLLERPLRRGPYTTEQKRVMKSFEQIVNGSIVQKEKNFYLQMQGAGEFEMGLVSEGYRKISTIMYLILSGSLSKNAILFWDEPETNMNPKMIKPVVDAVIELAKTGVQVFVTTHDYFVQHCFNMAAVYLNGLNKDEKALQYRFMSLYQAKNGILCEAADTLSDLTHNAVMEEFDQLYDREQELLYGE